MPDDSGSPLRHDAIMYDTADTLLQTTVPFIEDGLSAGEVVLVQVPEHTWSLIAPCLATTHAITRDPLKGVSDHPHQALWGLKQLVEEESRGGATAVRALSEISPATLKSDYAQWGRAESLVNTALSESAFWYLCPYSRNDLPAEVIEMAVSTHPFLVDVVSRRENPQFELTRDYLMRVDSVRASDPVESCPPFATQSLLTMTDLKAVRAKLEAAFDLTTLRADRRADLTDALFEVAVNAMLHGAEPASVRIWVTNDHILCMVRDSGAGLPDPLLGYQPPDRGSSDARVGLWSARQLCDVVTTTLEPEGFTVRLSLGF